MDAIVYIDGFNLYRGIRAEGWGRHLWLNVGGFGRALGRHVGHNVVAVKYFTARVGSPEASVKRQSNFLDAIKHSDPGLEIIPGNFIHVDAECRSCGAKWKKPEEKKTDVAIAVAMADDAFNGRCGAQLLVTADSDLVPAVELVRRYGMTVVNFVPPSRYCQDLSRASTSQHRLGRLEHLFDGNQMEELVQVTGTVVGRPTQWN